MYKREYSSEEAASRRASRANKRKRSCSPPESEVKEEKEDSQTKKHHSIVRVVTPPILIGSKQLYTDENKEDGSWSPTSDRKAKKVSAKRKVALRFFSPARLASVSKASMTVAASQLNAPQLADVIGRQSHAFHLELFDELKDKHRAAFFRLAQTLLKCNTVTDVDARFRKACEGTTSRERKIYDYLVPQDLKDYRDDFDGLISHMLEQRSDLDHNNGNAEKLEDLEQSLDTLLKKIEDERASSTTSGQDVEGKRDASSDDAVSTLNLDNITVLDLPSKPKLKINLSKADPTTALMDAIDLEVRFRHGARSDSQKQAIINSAETKKWRASRIRLFESGVERQAVRAHNRRYAHKPCGRRSIGCVRKAFDVLLLGRRGPKQPWRTSDDFFMATLVVVDTVPEVCLLWTEPCSKVFLDGLRFAMDKAEEWRAEQLLLSRTEEEYADLLGCERGTEWKDDFQVYSLDEEIADVC